MPKPHPATEADRAAKIAIPGVHEKEADRAASPFARRLDRTFTLPHFEHEPPVPGMGDARAYMPMGFEYGLLAPARDIVHDAKTGLDRVLAGNLERVEKVMEARMHELSARLDRLRREIDRLRGETTEMTDSPIDMVFAELRSKLDAVYRPPA